MNERAPVPCPEMVDIRARIDALDTELVMLLAQRQQLIEAAGKVKPARESVRDDARIEEVIQLVLARAREHNISTDIADTVWRQVIECSIAHEFDVFDER